jgi:translation initiation factor IF-2
MALRFMKVRSAHILLTTSSRLNHLRSGSLETFRHMKKDITEARKGMECGLSFDKFEDLREGDLIQVYQEIEKPGTL